MAWVPLLVWGEGETVLLAEDNESIRNFFLELLTGNGYEVIAATDGVEAVKLFRQHSNDVNILLFDVIMPRKKGK
jgi:two-component system cell cycle sensor histidine kinase/response regulator CckA